MFGLSLDWDRCPDGVALEAAAEVQERAQFGLRSRAYREWNRNRSGEERSRPPDDWLESRLAEYRIEEHREGGPHPYFKPRSLRLDPVRHELVSLDDPIVLHFVNARDDIARAQFLSRFGMLVLGGLVYRETDHGERMGARRAYYAIRRDEMSKRQADMLSLLVIAGGEDPMRAIDAINWALAGKPGGIVGGKITPRLDFGGGRGPRLALQPTSLSAFMVLELAMVVANGARLATCERCDKKFLTGHQTGRRSDSKYCSDRCRVAAMRARKAAQQ